MLKVRQIKIEVSKNNKDNLIKSISKKLKIDISNIENYTIKKLSIDARNKEEIYYVYEVNVNVKNELEILNRNKNNDVTLTNPKKYEIKEKGNLKINNRPMIVGSGPAGLFAAYILAENGYKPLIIERGENIEKRVESVETFWKTGKLNKNSNVQFGEGGAGTFSDGKLNTLIKDELCRGKKVFETFVENGADEEILYSYKPHIGTNMLRIVIKNMREKIIKMGGTFKYNTCLTNIIYENDTLKQIEVNNNELIDCDVLVLAIGHSARDTFYMLNNKLNMEAKPFAIGLRVAHKQSMIDESQFGKKYKDILSPATYKLTYNNDRGVYSFCMCPGGYIVNASSEENMLAINGMSNHERESGFANSAIVVTITPNDFGKNPLDGIEYQRSLEKKAYELGNGKIPVQLLKDFKENKISESLGNIEHVFKGDYKLANLNELLPIYISDSIKEGFISFGKKINGFDNDDTILAGIESRTSSPVRIIRNDLFESNIKGIYPSGEGAGYAGGITSAAIDGIKVAEAIIKKYEV